MVDEGNDSGERSVKQGITKKFNAFLFLYLMADILLDVLFKPESSANSLWDQLFDAFPWYLNSISLLGVGLLSIYYGALLVKMFWNQFIASVFSLREINLTEGIALTLIAMLIAG